MELCCVTSLILRGINRSTPWFVNEKNWYKKVWSIYKYLLMWSHHWASFDSSLHISSLRCGICSTSSSVSRTCWWVTLRRNHWGRISSPSAACTTASPYRRSGKCSSWNVAVFIPSSAKWSSMKNSWWDNVIDWGREVGLEIVIKWHPMHAS